jgi:hypothetical protein
MNVFSEMQDGIVLAFPLAEILEGGKNHGIEEKGAVDR